MYTYVYIYILAWTRAFNARSEVGLGNTAASKLAWTHFLAACLNPEIACRGFPGCLHIFGGSWGGCWALWEALQHPGLLLGLSCRSWGLLCLWSSPGRFWVGMLLATLPAFGPLLGDSGSPSRSHMAPRSLCWRHIALQITPPEPHGAPTSLCWRHIVIQITLPEPWMASWDHSAGDTLHSGSLSSQGISWVISWVWLWLLGRG